MIREKRSVSLHGHRTSVALETDFWMVIDAETKARGSSLAGLLAKIDDRRIEEKSRLGLASYLRVWALRQAKKKI